VQYLDFVYWERHCASQGFFDVPAGAKMQELCLQSSHVLDLPLDMPRTSKTTGGFAVFGYIRRAHVKELERWASGKRSSLVCAFLLAFVILLSSWSGQEDVSLGFPHHGRHQASLRNLIGSFMNVLPMSANVPRGESVLTLLA
jgi:hypothetical protein